MAVHRTRGGDETVAHDRLGVRADDEVDPVADVGVARATDSRDPPVLDSDVRLDHADRRVDHESPGDEHVELGVARSPAFAIALGHPRAKVLRVAPDRLVAGRLPVLLDAQPEAGVAEPDAVVDGRTVASQALVGRQPAAQRVRPRPLAPAASHGCLSWPRRPA